MEYIIVIAALACMTVVIIFLCRLISIIMQNAGDAIDDAMHIIRSIKGAKESFFSEAFNKLSKNILNRAAKNEDSNPPNSTH